MKTKKDKKTTTPTTAKKAPARKVRKATKAAKPAAKAVAFSYRADPGKRVYLAGSFNGWNPEGERMQDVKNDGVYTATITLAPGTYEYKFVVDGTWCADPECADWVQNDHGTLNSVITVK